MPRAYRGHRGSTGRGYHPPQGGLTIQSLQHYAAYHCHLAERGIDMERTRVRYYFLVVKHQLYDRFLSMNEASELAHILALAGIKGIVVSRSCHRGTTKLTQITADACKQALDDWAIKNGLVELARCHGGQLSDHCECCGHTPCVCEYEPDKRSHEIKSMLMASATA
jgi:hypothetical protein